jgi:hypothetical protein
MTNRSEELRKRLWHALSPNVAATAGLKVQDLQHVISGTRALTPEQETRLCLALGIR